MLEEAARGEEQRREHGEDDRREQHRDVRAGEEPSDCARGRAGVTIWRASVGEVGELELSLVFVNRVCVGLGNVVAVELGLQQF